MSHRLNAELAPNPVHHAESAIASAATCAVSHGNERRPEALEGRHRLLKQGLFRLVGLGREELEGDGRHRSCVEVSNPQAVSPVARSVSANCPSSGRFCQDGFGRLYFKRRSCKSVPYTTWPVRYASVSRSGAVAALSYTSGPGVRQSQYLNIALLRRNAQQGQQLQQVWELAVRPRRGEVRSSVGARWHDPDSDPGRTGGLNVHRHVADV